MPEWIINSYKNGTRTHVTNYENSYIKNHKVVKVFTDLWNKNNYAIIDRRYKNCCKSTNKIFKECFIIDTTIKSKELSLYFESTLDDNEFIMIMPIEIRKVRTMDKDIERLREFKKEFLQK